MSQTKVLAAMIPVIETFDCLGVDYYVGGAVASQSGSRHLPYDSGCRYCR
jgi:hypothetical protein